MKQIQTLLLLLALFFCPLAIASNEQLLGFLLYEDKNLSFNRNQSCSSCHSLLPLTGANSPLNKVSGFVDPTNVKTGSPVSSGSFPNKKGGLNAPSAGYAAFSPQFHWDEQEQLFVGGQFWNGRATDLVEQAKGPFLNPVEMAMPNEWSVVSRLKENLLYRYMFKEIYGLNLNEVPTYPWSAKTRPPTPNAVSNIYHHLAKAISAFEHSRLFNKFDSKFDFVATGKTDFTPIEQKGFELFNDPTKGNCAACHVSQLETDGQGKIIPPLFTDFTYDNIGLPRNINIPGNPEPNLGLGGRPDIAINDPDGNELGKHKVMSLRNIALTPPYGHNGVFKTLEQIVHFYNTRDTLGYVADNRAPGFGKSGWPQPEVLQNVNHDELGDLHLTKDEEQAIVAFLKTLTDGYPKWGNDPLVLPGSGSPY
jgi:cytochrome c peroxidase